METLIQDLDRKTAEVRMGGGTKAIERMRSKGKKLPRERCVLYFRRIHSRHLTDVCCLNYESLPKCTLVRRLALLLDPHTPFLELSSLAAHGVYPESVPGAGIITGIGRISGRECMVVVNDATVKGGSYYPLTVRSLKSLVRLHNPWCSGMALTCVALVRLGKETSEGTGNRKGEWTALRLCRSVILLLHDGLLLMS